MKTLKFSSKSWHARFIDRFTSFDSEYESVDLCRYVRLFFQAILVSALILAGITLACFLGTQVLVGIVFSLIHWMWIFSPFAEVTMLVLAILGSAISIVAGCEYARRVLNERSKIRSNEPDSFVVNAYKSWKDKYCARIEFDSKEA